MSSNIVYLAALSYFGGLYASLRLKHIALIQLAVAACCCCAAGLFCMVSLAAVRIGASELSHCRQREKTSQFRFIVLHGVI